MGIVQYGTEFGGFVGWSANHGITLKSIINVWDKMWHSGKERLKTSNSAKAPLLVEMINNLYHVQKLESRRLQAVKIFLIHLAFYKQQFD